MLRGCGNKSKWWIIDEIIDQLIDQGGGEFTVGGEGACRAVTVRSTKAWAHKQKEKDQIKHVQKNQKNFKNWVFKSTWNSTNLGNTFLSLWLSNYYTNIWQLNEN